MALSLWIHSPLFWVQNTQEWEALFCPLAACGQGHCDLAMECWRRASLEVSKSVVASRKPTLYPCPSSCLTTWVVFPAAGLWGNWDLERIHLPNELHVAGCRGAWGSVVFQTWSPPCLLATSCLNAEAESGWGRHLVTEDRVDARDSRMGSSRLSRFPPTAPSTSSASGLDLSEVDLL